MCILESLKCNKHEYDFIKMAVNDFQGYLFTFQ